MIIAFFGEPLLFHKKLVGLVVLWRRKLHRKVSTLLVSSFVFHALADFDALFF